MEIKSALVTGGSRGIGRAIVLALAARGWQVVFSYLAHAEAAEETRRAAVNGGGRALPVQADVSEETGREHLIQTVLDSFGRVDLLVNNAGIAPRVRTDLLEVSETSYDEVMTTNLKGPFFLTRRVARVMMAQADREDGLTPVIINIGSISAYTSSVNRAEYCLSKAGMAMMTRLFADRLAEEGIRVYEVRPGIIATEMTAGVRDKYDRLIDGGLLPLRRWGQPDDVARAVVMLAEGALPYSTGEVINVDGGFHLRRL